MAPRDRDQVSKGTAGADLRTALSSATADGGTAPIDAVIDDMVKAQEEHLEVLKAITYGAVECSASDGSVSDKFGRKSCAAIETLVSIPSLGIKIPVTIWAVLQNTTDGREVKFEGSAPRGCKFTGDGKTLLLAHAETAAQLWNGYDKATDNAANRLMGIGDTMRGTDGQTITRPKLVKRVQIVAAAEPPTRTVTATA